MTISQKIEDKRVTQVLLSVSNPGRFALSTAMHERFKDYDGPAPDNKEAHEGVHERVYEGVHDDLSEIARKILQACEKIVSVPEILENLGYKSRSRNFRTAVADLLEKEFIEITLPDTPRSKNQKYRLTQTGKPVVHRSDIKDSSYGRKRTGTV